MDHTRFQSASLSLGYGYAKTKLHRHRARRGQPRSQNDLTVSVNSLSTFEHAVHAANQWVRELAQDPQIGDDARAYSILRVVLHGLRDSLNVGEAARFSSQLPTLLRGVFFEGWRPTHVPRPKGAYLLEVERGLARLNSVSAERATRLVYDLLAHRIAAGELRHVRNVLPPELIERRVPI